MSTIERRVGLLPVLGIAVALGGWVAPVAAGRGAPATPQVSANWAGYAVTGSSSRSALRSFTAVAGRWIVPRASCDSAGLPAGSGSAFWVGLGGFGADSQALEQIGTEEDCVGSGLATYFAWYELLPSAPVHLKLKVVPGDTVNARVEVSGKNVLLQITDRSRGTGYAKQLSVASPDLSSAEWIAEAPSECDGYGRCRPVPLTNFGTVSFTKASATASGRQGRIADPAWSATAIQLASDDPTAAYPGYHRWWRRELPMSPPPGAVPAALSADGASFSVHWQQAGPTPTSQRPGNQDGGSPYGD